jgi:NADPH2:quinone reductase
MNYELTFSGEKKDFSMTHKDFPPTMFGIEISKPGGPDVMRLVEMPCPVPKENEVLVQVKAAGINRADVFQRQGYYPPPPGISEVPGLEVSGVIVAVGSGVTKFKVNDAVCCLVAGGGYAQYCVVPEATCLRIPGKLTFVEAASLPETYFTVWSNLFEKAALKPTETVFVQGGSSGIGVSAISLCHALGIKIYVTAGSDEKCRACEALGATKAINYKTENFVQVMTEVTGGRGVDVVLDMVGGDYVTRELAMMAHNGRLIFIKSYRVYHAFTTSGIQS